jgi:hypothetical protein
MAETDVKLQHFQHLAGYSIAICKDCRHGVLPSHIKSHLHRAHKVKDKQAENIAERVRSWAGLIECASEIQVPSQVIPPISQLPVYSDGLLCQLDAAYCFKVLRSIKAMKNHWREVHDWSVGSKGGHLSQLAQKKIQLRIDEGCRRVHCQRLLIQGPGSQYFEVQLPNDDDEPAVPVDSKAAWARVGAEMAKVWEAEPLRMNTRNHAPGGHGCANLIGCRSSAGAWLRGHSCATLHNAPLHLRRKSEEAIL